MPLALALVILSEGRWHTAVLVASAPLIVAYLRVLPERQVPDLVREPSGLADILHLALGILSAPRIRPLPAGIRVCTAGSAAAVTAGPQVGPAIFLRRLPLLVRRLLFAPRVTRPRVALLQGIVAFLVPGLCFAATEVDTGYSSLPLISRVSAPIIPLLLLIAERLRLSDFPWFPLLSLLPLVIVC